ncbi:MAG: leucine--tRNA ligase [Minisyncoccota bacterium]
MNRVYRPKSLETKWQKTWERQGTYRQYKRSRQCYVLDMFPYPSGAGLHVGHPRGFVASDVYARFKQLQGYGVLHPMGWDAFGLPAEQYAIKNNVHPAIAVKKNIATYKKQLQRIGCTYDWEREINTTDPEYYRWTQWIFLQLWKKGLAYQSFEPIQWCPTCQTGLANEDVDQGRCERCESVVEQRPMRQWMLKITAYADKMLRDLQNLEWPEGVKEAQRNWIGRSEGTEIVFCIADTEEEIRVFTTRVDTIFGCTYLVLAPEHPLIHTLEKKITNLSQVKKYREETAGKSDIERTGLTKEKTGVLLEGIEAVHPFTGKRLPVFVADYVLKSYGTGAVMAVPAHDKRDFVFAKKYQLEILTSVIDAEAHLVEEKTGPFTDDGILVDSGNFSGLTSVVARTKITTWLQKEKMGKKRVNYKLRDWVFSRQRYWGEPIPLVHCTVCGVVPVPENALPVRLPSVKSYQPTGTGESPLADILSWVNVRCPKCTGPAKRETNTMPQWAGSSWYYLRFIDPSNTRVLVSTKKEKMMMPVDVYVGGDHATRHLIYARFWHKFLYDQGIVSTREPFKRLEFLGLILATDGRKMSKRWGNVVNPDDIIAEFGADAFRVYEMFMGPFTQSIAWNTDGVVGARRFLEKVWRLGQKMEYRRTGKTDASLTVLLHQTIKKVTEDIEGFKFNTALSALMILVNALEKHSIPLSQYKTLLVLLAPFAPHIAEELWMQAGHKKSLFLSVWPKWDKTKIVAKTVNIVIQVNGKVRMVLPISVGASEEQVKTRALQDEKIQIHLVDKTMRKIIFVPDKILNIVVS